MSDTTYKLPIWRTARDTYALIFANFGFLIRQGWPWMLLAMVLQIGFDWTKTQFAAQGGDAASAFRDLATSMLQSFIQVASLAPLAVLWHRHVLHASERTIPLTRIVLAYGVAALLIELICTDLIPAPVNWLTASNSSTIRSIMEVTLICLLFLAGTYVWSRVMLVLPAIALERDYSIRASWMSSTGNGWRLFFSSLLTVLPPIVLAFCFVLSRPTAQLDATTKSAVLTSLIQWNWYDAIESTLLFIPFAIIAISFLSVAYRELVLNREGAASPAP